MIVGLTLTGPVDADLTADDAVLLPDDEALWYIEGEPGRFIFPFSNEGHFEAALTRQKG